jgi:hypothetical protein
VRATVVTRNHLDILVTVTAIELVFDAEIREMDSVIEIRQIMFLGPFRDLKRVPIWSAVAVSPVSVVLLEELLIFPLEINLQHDALDLRAFLAQAVSVSTYARNSCASCCSSRARLTPE